MSGTDTARPWLDDLLTRLASLEQDQELELDWDGNESWVLVEQLFALAPTELVLRWSDQGDLTADLAAEAQVGGVTLDVDLQLPSQSYRVTRSNGSDAWPLASLANSVGAGSLDLGSLAVSDLVVAGSLRTGVVNFGVEFDPAASWEQTIVPGLGLSLDTVRADITSYGSSAVVAVGASATLTPTGATSAQPLTADASLTYDSSGGWEVELDLGAIDDEGLRELLGGVGLDGADLPAGLVLDQVSLSYRSAAGSDPALIEVVVAGSVAAGVSIADLVSGLAAPTGAQLPTPPFLDEAALTSLMLSLGKAGADWVIQLNGNGTLGEPIGSSQATAPTLRFEASIANDDQGYELEVGGSVRLGVGTEAIDLALLIEWGDTDVAVARFDDPDGQTVDISPLVPGGSGSDQLTLTVRDVLLIWYRDGSESRYLLAFDVASAGLGSVPDIPIVGSLLSAEQPLAIGYRVIAASAAFSIDDLSSVNSSLADHEIDALPQTSPLTAGVTFAGRLDLADETVTIEQPVADDSAAGGGQPLEPAAGDVTWRPVQRSFGPLHVSRVGLAYADGALTFLLDAAVTLGGLELTFQGFGVTSPLAELDPKIELTGMGLEYRSGAVTIGGTFLRSEDEFLGSVVIQTKTFSLEAFGAFGEVDGQPSLFVYAVLHRAFGGPPAFFVTGLAAGFGYNRDFITPAVTAVETHPFVAALEAGPPLALPEPTAASADMLADLGHLVPSRIGSYWFAAGVTFESFKMIQSRAVVLVKLDDEVEILLVGLAELTLPRGTGRKPYLRAELALKASVRPEAGVATVEARLTEDSYVVTPECDLRGGFAFSIWFGDNPHRGDFVVTLGGYHPAFRPPSHYPAVPRLEVGWRQGAVTIKGEAYFALTPSCIMAGGQLEAVYRDGGLTASLVMRAHFLIEWNPFSYDIEIGVSIRAEYRTETLLGPVTLAAALSADLRLWGPELAGRATVDWTVSSFEVEFGAIDADPPGRDPLDWATFSDSYLPPAADVCSLHLVAGLVAEREGSDGSPEWVVRAADLMLTTRSVVPSTVVTLAAGGASLALPPLAADDRLGVQPMGSGRLRSEHVLSLTSIGSDGTETDIDLTDETKWQHDGAARQAVPKELWNDVAFLRSPSADTLPNRPVGLERLRPVVQLPASSGAGRDIAGLQHVPAGDPLPLPLSTTVPPADPLLPEPNPGVFERMKTSLDDDGMRSTVIARAKALGFLRPGPGEPLDVTAPVVPLVLAANPSALLAAPPMLGNEVLGGPTSPPAQEELAPPPVVPDSSPPPAAPRLAIRLLAEVRDHPLAGADEHSTRTVRRPEGRSHLVVASTEDVAPRAEAELARSIPADGSLVFELTRTGDEEVPAGTDGPLARLELADGPAKRRVVALDRYGTIVHDGERSGAFDLDPAVALVAVLPGSATSSGRPVAAGWHGSSSLLSVGGRTYLADRALVATESEDRRDPAATAAAVRAAAVIRANPGPVRTSLPPTVETVAVYVARGSGPPAAGYGSDVEVRLPGQIPVALTPQYIVNDGPGEIALLYRVLHPTPPEPGDEPLEVTVRMAGENGWVLDGVVGLSESLHVVRRDWQAGRSGLQAPTVDEEAALELVAIVDSRAA